VPLSRARPAHAVAAMPCHRRRRSNVLMRTPRRCWRPLTRESTATATNTTRTCRGERSRERNSHRRYASTRHPSKPIIINDLKKHRRIGEQ
jgi:hypothetical protein